VEPTPLEKLRLANREFREFVEEVSKHGASPGQPRLALGRIEHISATLVQVGQHLKQALRTPEHSEEFRRELQQYEERLREMKGVLERLQYSLLVERARMQEIRAHLEAASAWAAPLRQTSRAIRCKRGGCRACSLLLEGCHASYAPPIPAGCAGHPWQSQ